MAAIPKHITTDSLSYKCINIELSLKPKMRKTQTCFREKHNIYKDKNVKKKNIHTSCPQQQQQPTGCSPEKQLCGPLHKMRWVTISIILSSIMLLFIFQPSHKAGKSPSTHRLRSKRGPTASSSVGTRP